MNTIQGSIICFKMVGFAQWKWNFFLQNKNSYLGFSGLWQHGWISLGWGNWDEVSLQIISSYNNIYACLHWCKNSSIHGKYLLNGRKESYYYLVAKFMNGSALKPMKKLRDKKFMIVNHSKKLKDKDLLIKKP